MPGLVAAQVIHPCCKQSILASLQVQRIVQRYRNPMLDMASVQVAWEKSIIINCIQFQYPEYSLQQFHGAFVDNCPGWGRDIASWCMFSPHKSYSHGIRLTSIWFVNNNVHNIYIYTYNSMVYECLKRWYMMIYVPLQQPHLRILELKPHFHG